MWCLHVNSDEWHFRKDLWCLPRQIAWSLCKCHLLVVIHIHAFSHHRFKRIPTDLSKLVKESPRILAIPRWRGTLYFRTSRETTILREKNSTYDKIGCEKGMWILNLTGFSAHIRRNDFGLTRNVECATVVHFWIFFMNRYLHVYFLKIIFCRFGKIILNRFYRSLLYRSISNNPLNEWVSKNYSRLVVPLGKFIKY